MTEEPSTRIGTKPTGLTWRNFEDEINQIEIVLIDNSKNDDKEKRFINQDEIFLSLQEIN